MRFICDQCKAKYSITDEKVRGKILKIRCKRCGNIIEVRDPAARPSQLTSRPQTGAMRPSTGLEPSPIASTGSGPRPAPVRPPAPGEGDLSGMLDALSDDDGEDRTQISSPGLLDELRRTAAQIAHSASAEPDLVEWYVAVDDAPVGPITRERVRALISTGKAGGDNLVWREGYDDWRPLRESAQLSSLLSAPGSKSRVSAPPPRQTRTSPAPLVAPPGETGPRARPLAPPPASPLRGQFVGRLGAVPPPVREPRGEPGLLAPLPRPVVSPLDFTPAAGPPPAPAFAPRAALPPTAPIAPPRAAPSAPQPVAPARTMPSVPAPVAPPRPTPAAPESHPARLQLVPPPPEPPAGPAKSELEASLEALASPLEAVAPPSSTPSAPAPQPRPVIPEPPPRKEPAEAAGSALTGPPSLVALAQELAVVRDSIEPSPSMVAAVRASRKSNRGVVIVIAGVLAVLLGIGATITIIKSGGGGSAAAEPRVPQAVRPEPLQPVVSSLEIPLGSGAGDAGPATDEPTLVSPDATSYMDFGGALTKGGNGVKVDQLSEADRIALAKAAEMGNDTSSPLAVKREGNGGASTAPRGQPLSEDAIRNTISKNRTSIQRCYEREMRGRQGGSDLRVVVRVTVRPSGAVGAAQVSPPDIRGTGLGTCIESAVRRWQFPIASAESTVEAPFLLTPGQGQ